MSSQGKGEAADGFPEVLLVDEVLQLLRISRPVLDRLLKNNELPGVRQVGKERRFSKAALLRWMETGDQPPLQ